jgi:hypothetical protein
LFYEKIKNKFYCSLSVLFLLFFSFGVCGEEVKESSQTSKSSNEAKLNLICKLKNNNYEPVILSGFSTGSFYNSYEVSIWNSSRPSKFIPAEIEVDKNGIEIMKGVMFGSNRRQARVEFKDGSFFTYDIYTTKNEWDCIENEK